VAAASEQLLLLQALQSLEPYHELFLLLLFVDAFAFPASAAAVGLSGLLLHGNEVCKQCALAPVKWNCSKKNK